MRLTAAAASDKGRVRAINEDSFACRPEAGLFVVCDGMGGAAAGEVASQLAISAIVEYVTQHEEHTPDDTYRAETVTLAAAITHANLKVCERAREDAQHAGMGTTVVGVLIADHVASVAHMGDSRAYLWQSGRFERLTRDHSLVEEEVRAGLLEREGSMQSEHQDVLLRALGGEPDADVELSEVAVQPGDYLLLCSDGLTRTVSDAGMQEAIDTLRDPQRICERLIAEANGNGAPDNVTVVVAQVMNEGFRRFFKR